MIKYAFKHKRKVGNRVVTARVYTGCYRLDGETQQTRVPLGVSDKQVAERKLDEIVREKEREAAGILAPKPLRPPNTAPAGKVLIRRMLAGMWKMKIDLCKAGIPYIVDGRRADFHALRHTLATNLAKANVPLRLAMEMMRHSDIRLTTNTYTDAKLLPLMGIVESLPSFLSKRRRQRQGKHTKGTQTPDFSGQKLTPSVNPDNTKGFVQEVEDEELWRAMALPASACDDEEMAPAVGFEETIRSESPPCRTVSVCANSCQKP